MLTLCAAALFASLPQEDSRPWALVTGASSGIGAALAHEAAAKGFNTILVARRRPRLEDLADELHAVHGARSLIIQADLASAIGLTSVHNAAAKLDGRLELLILNAGICPSPSDFALQSVDADLQPVVDLNVVANMALLQRIGASLATQGSGRVLIVASSAGAAPGVPGVAAYAASKAFLRSLAAGAGVELRRSGVTVTCAMPGAVDSEFASKSGLEASAVFTLPGVRKVGGVVLSANLAAKQMLAAALRGQREIVPGLLPRLYVGLSDRRMLPVGLSRSIAAFSFGAVPKVRRGVLSGFGRTRLLKSREY